MAEAQDLYDQASEAAGFTDQAPAVGETYAFQAARAAVEAAAALFDEDTNLDARLEAGLTLLGAALASVRIAQQLGTANEASAPAP